MSQCMICLEEGNVRQYCKCEKETSLMHLECMHELRGHTTTCRFCSSRFREHWYEVYYDDVEKGFFTMEIVRFLLCMCLFDLSRLDVFLLYEIFYGMFLVYTSVKFGKEKPPLRLVLTILLHSFNSLCR